MDADAAQGGHAVGGHFHDQGRCLTAQHGFAQQQGHAKGQHPRKHNDGKHHVGGIVRKKRAHQQQVHGQLCAAGHVGQGEHGGQFFLGAAHGARGHNTRYGAAASNAARNNVGHHRGPVQAKKLEHPVGNVGHAGHIAAVFHNGDKRKHDEHKRYKTEHTANASDYAVHQQRGKQALWQRGPHKTSQRDKRALKPALWIRTQNNGDLKHGVEHGQHDYSAPQGMGQHSVQLV